MDIEALSLRITRLERANMRLRLVSAVVGLAALGSCSTDLAGKRTLDVQELVIRDSQGRARATIGTPRLSGSAVGMSPDSPAIWLTGENGSDRLVITTDGIYLADERAKRLMEIGGALNGPVLRIYDAGGKMAWSAP